MTRPTASRLRYPWGEELKGMSGLKKKELHELDRHYDRILAPSTQGPRASAALRLALQRIPARLSLAARRRDVVLGLLDRVLRAAELGGFDLTGTPRQLDEALAESLGEEPHGARSVYLALSLLVGKSALVERPSRQRWSLRISGLCDQSSAVHRALLAETPSLHILAPEGPPTQGQADAPTSSDVQKLLRRIVELESQLLHEQKLRENVEARLAAKESTATQAIELVSRDATQSRETPQNDQSQLAEGQQAEPAADSRHSADLTRARPRARPKRKKPKKPRKPKR